VLTETKNSIDENLTLDNDQSALARLKKQLSDVLDDIRTKNAKFQEDVSAKLATLITKRKEAERSTTHGNDFEQEFCSFVQNEVQHTGDVFTATGTKAGAVPKCKKGDAVIEIGAESTAAGAKIVLEAKGNKSYTLGDARTEIEEARRTEVQRSVFSFSREPGRRRDSNRFTRIDKDIFVIWDASDPSTDVYLSAAISVAKALVFRQENRRKDDKRRPQWNRIVGECD